MRFDYEVQTGAAECETGPHRAIGAHTTSAAVVNAFVPTVVS
jgi:hypothetical protein